MALIHHTVHKWLLQNLRIDVHILSPDKNTAT